MSTVQTYYIVEASSRNELMSKVQEKLNIYKRLKLLGGVCAVMVDEGYDTEKGHKIQYLQALYSDDSSESGIYLT